MVADLGRFASMATCALCVCLSTPAGARADLTVGWDCYLTRGAVDCTRLENAYLSSVPGLERGGAPALALKVRSTSLDQARRYTLTFDGGEAGPTFELVEEVSTTLRSDEALNRVLAALHRGTVPFLEVDAPGRIEDGSLRLDARTAAAGDDDDEDDDPSAWYARPRVSGELVSAGLTILALRGELEINRSDEDYRLRLVGGGQYRYMDVELADDQRLEGDVTTGWGSATWAHSVGGGVSVAALGGGARMPHNNVALRAEAGLGVEWLDEPFLENDEGNIGARYRILGVRDRYVTDNMDGERVVYYPRHRATVFGRLHEGAIDLGVDVSAGAPVDRPELWGVGGEASVTVRVASGLEVGLSAGLTYRGGAINEPADPDALDPVATLVSGSDYGTLTYVAEVSLAWTVGNGLLRSQDQRWR